MPKIAEIKIVDGEVWCKVGTPGEFENGVALWTPEEQERNYRSGYNDAKAELVEGQKFEQSLVNTVRKIMGEYDATMCSEMAGVASVEVSSMGNFTDPQTEKQYGFRFTVGEPDFHDESEDVGEDEDEDDF
jgi:hypothetical protein